jgi:hypothetical protein
VRVCSFHVRPHGLDQGQGIEKRILLGATETRIGRRIEIGTGETEIGTGIGIDVTVTEIAGDEVGIFA